MAGGIFLIAYLDEKYISLTSLKRAVETYHELHPEDSSTMFQALQENPESLVAENGLAEKLKPLLLPFLTSKH